ncbi:MAG TPA: hypothetical protein VGF18_09950, partial [Candidatus Tumulicola sp.]
MTPGTPSRHASLGNAQLEAAERLYYAGAPGLAADRLESFARDCPDDDLKATALARLALIAADQDDAIRAERAMREAHTLL